MSGEQQMWMECFAGDVRIDGPDVETVVDRFVQHAAQDHDWTFPEDSLRNYARNYAEANVRLTGSTERLSEIGEVAVYPVDESRIDDWIGFFDHDAFAGNPDWASCYCLEPHLPAAAVGTERPWRETRATMIERLAEGATYGYLAYVDGHTAGWVNASLRSDYQLFGQVDPEGPSPAAVVGVSCFIIAPPYRRHGIAASLLDRVIEDAPARGAKWVEGYPINEPQADDAGHFRGPRGLYESRGFEPVESRERDMVMRRPADRLDS